MVKLRSQKNLILMNLPLPGRKRGKKLRPKGLNVATRITRSMQKLDDGLFSSKERRGQFYKKSPIDIRKHKRRLINHNNKVVEIKERNINRSSPPAEVDDGIKTRRIQKSKDSSPKCAMCKYGEDDEPLRSCYDCSSLYHLEKCLKYHKTFVKSILDPSNKWKCARCINCKKCDDFIADPSNIECWSCCNAWHGTCAPRGHRRSQDFNSVWYCDSCCAKKGILIDLASSSESLRSEQSVEPSDRPTDINDILLTDINIDSLLNERKQNIEHAMDVLRNVSPFKTLLSPKKKTEEREKITKPTKKIPYSSETAESSLTTTKFDRHLYLQAKKRFEKRNTKNGDDFVEDDTKEQWVTFGDGVSFKAVCPSSYPAHINKSPNIYICRFCLHATNKLKKYEIHWKNCTWRFPPGTEIYRDGNLSFFEVDGSKQSKYCRNLCLLSKLFISSKTLFHEVDTFSFYVLCEIKREGFVIVGYFSKEKNPSKNNNLSCLLTFPSAQKSGYGRFLIDLSYALSRRDLKVGSPEHPLSDLGILAYRGYWRSSILCYLRSIKGNNQVSIKDISIATRIHPIDVVNQLLLDNILLFKNNSYYIKTWKRAYKHPLSQLRRRCINMDKLQWYPKPEDLIGLDATKLNNYV